MSTERQQLQAKTMDSSIVAGFETAGGFELLMRMANAFANSTIVPKDYQKVFWDSKANNNIGAWIENPNAIANCTIAVNMALRMQADPMMVMQNLVIVHGRPSWSAKFLLATVNSCKRFSALRFEWVGEPGKDSWGCRAVATEIATGERLEGVLITIKMAKDEKWYERNGSKWKTMPQKMLMYRAGAWWCDIYSPELAMGLRTDDEVLDAFDAEPDMNGIYTVRNESDLRSNILDSIESASSRSDLDALLPSIGELPAAEQKSVRKEWVAKANSFAEKPITQEQPKTAEIAPEKTSKSEEKPTDWAQAIKECGDVNTLNALLQEMPESEQIELQDLIDEHFDYLRTAG